MFIVLEGVEGCGKSTQAQRLGDWLAAEGIPCRVTREPGGTQIGEEIRRALLHGGDEVPARTELLLMLASRAAFVEQVVAPALASGAVVIADRYELSSLAYQGYGRGLPLEQVRSANSFATGGLSPDLTIILEIEWSDAVARRGRAGAAADRIERAGDEFHQRVAEAYRLLSQTEHGVEAVPGSGDVDSVHESILRLLNSRFPETFRIKQG
jgi:dTMP kinase